jgi:hypothetical protein
MSFFGVWFTAGFLVDGWIRLHAATPLDAVLAPWRVLLYSGYLACAVLLLGAAWVSMRRGFSLKNALPAHYTLSLYGIIAFPLVVVLDAWWYQRVPVIGSMDVLLSPTRLLFALCMVVVVAGPLRELLRRHDENRRGLLAEVPPLLSLVSVIAVFSFTVQFLHPFIDVWPAQLSALPFFGEALGIAQIVFFIALLMSLILLLLRRRDLPVGSFTFILGLHALSMAAIGASSFFVVASIVAGGIIDMLLSHAGRRLFEPRVIRLFAFSVPVVFTICYFAVIEMAGGILWSEHVWLSAISIAGLTGWLISYVVVPPYHDHASTREKGEGAHPLLHLAGAAAEAVLEGVHQSPWFISAHEELARRLKNIKSVTEEEYQSLVKEVAGKHQHLSAFDAERLTGMLAKHGKRLVSAWKEAAH